MSRCILCPSKLPITTNVQGQPAAARNLGIRKTREPPLGLTDLLGGVCFQEPFKGQTTIDSPTDNQWDVVVCCSVIERPSSIKPHVDSCFLSSLFERHDVVGLTIEVVPVPIRRHAIVVDGHDLYELRWDNGACCGVRWLPTDHVRSRCDGNTEKDARKKAEKE